MELKLKIKYEEQLKNDPLAKVGYTVNKKRRFKSLLWVSKNPVQAICDLKLEHMFEGTPETFQKIINAVSKRQGIDEPRKVRLPKEDMYAAISLDSLLKDDKAKSKAKSNLINNL